jgi:hypothetical protein
VADELSKRGHLRDRANCEEFPLSLVRQRPIRFVPLIVSKVANREMYVTAVLARAEMELPKHFELIWTLVMLRDESAGPEMMSYM